MPFVIFTEAAQADMNDILDWYESINPNLRLRFQAEVRILSGRIEAHPEMYAVVSKKIRRAVFNGFPYALYYRVEPQFVSVIGCFHNSRNPRVWRRRM